MILLGKNRSRFFFFPLRELLPVIAIHSTFHYLLSLLPKSLAIIPLTEGEPVP